MKNVTPYLGWFINTKFELSNPFLFSDYSSTRFSTELDIFLPILNENNLELYFGYLFRNGDYKYLNNFDPIGFISNYNKHQFRFITSYYKPLIYLEWQTPIIPIFVEYIYLKPFFDYGIRWSNQSEITNINSIGLQLTARNIIFYRYSFDIGINIYKKSTTNNIDYIPFIRFNL